MSAALLPLAEASALIAAKRLSPVELLADCLSRISALEPQLNAFIRQLPDEAMAQAKQAEAEIASHGPRSALHGIPIGL
jgi:aspartyl-tRNA(Asn)/glutamyl-tRNA(Gln) amidotransferase subunit A